MSWAQSSNRGYFAWWLNMTEWLDLIEWIQFSDDSNVAVSIVLATGRRWS